jgi:hypothetical protein
MYVPPASHARVRPHPLIALVRALFPSPSETSPHAGARYDYGEGETMPGVGPARVRNASLTIRDDSCFYPLLDVVACSMDNNRSPQIGPCGADEE